MHISAFFCTSFYQVLY